MTQVVRLHMKKTLPLAIASIVASSAMSTQALASADDITAALTGGTVYGDFNLRYEHVDQDLKETAKALTLRSRLGYNTAQFQGFSATVEFEDSRVVADVDKYEQHPLARPAGYTPNGRAVIADPETTELDQAYLQYKVSDFTFKAGRQVLTYDNHRFVGHVGWRQDRQTFDAFTVNYALSKDLEINYAFLGQRNRIFAEISDVNSKDHLVNIGYKTGLGKVTAYSYLLEEDNGTDNSLDTYGLRFAGSTAIDDSMKALYALEYAYQENEVAGITEESEYYLVEGGLEVAGITGTLGYEVLGDSDGASFQTPLATLHKFNGWADMFLTPAQYADGLTDLYISLAGKLAGGKWEIAYHDFEADKGSADLGSELDISYGKGFGKNYSAGVKYAAYSAGDTLVDTDKVWLWLGAKF